jgi:hypothetical protein
MGDESIIKLFAKTLDCLNISIRVYCLFCCPTASERETRKQEQAEEPEPMREQAAFEGSTGGWL